MKTYEDSLSLKSALEDAVLGLSGSRNLAKGFFESHFSQDQAKYVLDWLENQKVNQLSREEVLDALKKLTEKLGQVKALDLEIAVEPDDSLKKTIHNWLSKNIGEFVFPRYKINPAVVGGAKIVFGGNLLDLSLRRKIDELPLFKRKI